MDTDTRLTDISHMAFMYECGTGFHRKFTEYKVNVNRPIVWGALLCNVVPARLSSSDSRRALELKTL